MPSKPNDSRSRKRKNVVAAPPSDRRKDQAPSSGQQKGETRASDRPNEQSRSSVPDIREAEEQRLSFTPLQLLATILKSVLHNRITDEEIARICAVYYDSVLSIWADEEG